MTFPRVAVLSFMLIFQVGLIQGQEQLPGAIRADVERVKVENRIREVAKALAEERYQEALTGLEALREEGHDLPPSSDYVEGKAAAGIGDWTRAKTALNQYFEKTGRDGSYYNDALQTYLIVEENEKTAIAQAEEQERQAALAAEAQAKREEVGRRRAAEAEERRRLREAFVSAPNCVELLVRQLDKTTSYEIKNFCGKSVYVSYCVNGIQYNPTSSGTVPTSVPLCSSGYRQRLIAGNTTFQFHSVQTRNAEIAGSKQIDIVLAQCEHAYALIQSARSFKCPAKGS